MKSGAQGNDEPAVRPNPPPDPALDRRSLEPSPRLVPGEQPHDSPARRSEVLLEPGRIARGLSTAAFGRTIHCFEEVDSTNRVASELAGKGAAEGTLVIAEKQTAGRGSRGRQWDSPPGVGIWCSLVLRPNLPCEMEWAITAATAIGTVTAIRETTGLDARLKWPNDVLIAGRKVCGILTEARLASASRHSTQPLISVAVVGIGVNVNQALGDFRPLLRSSATSLKIALKGKTIDRLHLLQRMIEEAERNYRSLRSRGPAALVARWRELSCTVGQVVTMNTGRGVVRGIAVDVRPDGGLLLEDESGGSATVLVDEVVGRQEV